MDDGLGPASKKRKLSDSDLPLGLTKVGGLEGLLKLGLASEGLVELQAQLQKKVSAFLFGLINWILSNFSSDFTYYLSIIFL